MPYKENILVMTCKLTPHPFAFPCSHTIKLHVIPRYGFHLEGHNINFDASMTPQSSNEPDSDKPIVEWEFKKAQHSKDEEVQSILKPCSETKNKLEHDQAESKSTTKEEATQSNSDSVETTLQVQEPSATPLMEKTRILPLNMEAHQGAVSDSGRERLKRHRVEVAGRVWIPDMWGQEGLLKDWIDCSAFDAALMNGNIMSARAALVQEGRRANSSRLRIQNSC